MEIRGRGHVAISPGESHGGDWGGVPGRRSALVAQARTLEPDTRHQLAILGT